MIIQLENSTKPNKRFKITMDNGKQYDFGYKGGSTYIDHKDKAKRTAYLKRHLANKTENQLISNLIPSPSLFSAYILWSMADPEITTIKENIELLNRLWKKKHGTTK